MEAHQTTMGTGTWAHSFEEDEGDIQVYRLRASYPFPPSRRGRETLEFDASGRASAAGMPGPDDRMMPKADVPRFEVVEAGPDILKVRMH
jgi:hypothetical protein